MHTASSASRTNIAWRSDSVNNATVDRLSCSKFISRIARIKRIAASPRLTMAILSKRCSLLYLMVYLSLLVHFAQGVHDPCQRHDSCTMLVVVGRCGRRENESAPLPDWNIPVPSEKRMVPIEMKRSTWGSQ